MKRTLFIIAYLIVLSVYCDPINQEIESSIVKDEKSSEVIKVKEDVKISEEAVNAEEEAVNATEIEVPTDKPKKKHRKNRHQHLRNRHRHYHRKTAINDDFVADNDENILYPNGISTIIPMDVPRGKKATFSAVIKSRREHERQIKAWSRLIRKSRKNKQLKIRLRKCLKENRVRTCRCSFKRDPNGTCRP